MVGNVCHKCKQPLDTWPFHAVSVNKFEHTGRCPPMPTPAAPQECTVPAPSA